MKGISFFLGIISVVLFIGYFIPAYFFPSDILNYLPSFSEENWQRPHNSLLADPVFQFEPWRYYAKLRILNGEIPLWNSFNGKGAPFLANPQTAVLYPLNVFYYLFSAKTALFIIPVLKILFLGMFTYLYFRSLGIEKRIGIIGSLVIMFSAFPIVWVLWPHTNVFILFPLLLFITEKIYKSSQFIHRWYCLLIIVYAVAVLGGHPETLFHVGLIHLSYVLLLFKKETKKILYVCITIFIGFLLVSFILLPFLEYLLHSSVFERRIAFQNNFSLPILSFISNVVPFILGAPHTQFYKPFSVDTNFQEVIGGYVGFAIFFVTMIFTFLFTKNSRKTFWLYVLIFSWGVAYKVFPFSILSKFPIFSSIANHRIIGFSGFGVGVLFVFLLDSVSNGKIKVTKKIKQILRLVIFICFATAVFFHINLEFSFTSDFKINMFTNYLKNHVGFVLFTTSVFLFAFYKFIILRKLTKFLSILLVGSILLQSIFLFWNYIPFTLTRLFYPEIQLVKDLKKLENGEILEVGNPSLPPNVNMVYGFQYLENDDAMEVSWYRNSFDKEFPIKNQWKKVDEIKNESLDRFGVRYVISDYNLLLEREKIQPKYEKILPKIVKDRSLEMVFKGRENRLKEIRLLTANFNRLNTCILSVKIIERSANQIIGSSNTPCKNTRDFTYFSIPFENVQLMQGKEYKISFTSSNADEGNSIALWGNKAEKPYVELLYENVPNIQIFNDLILRFQGKTYYIFENLHYKEIDGVDSYSVILQKPEKIQYLISLNENKKIEIKKTYYPGWNVYLDGKKITVSNGRPFINVFATKGEHVLELLYKPWSFWIGLSISLFTLTALFVFFIRKESKEKWFVVFYKKCIRWTDFINKRVKWWEHFIVFLMSLPISCLFFLILISIVKISFSMPQTTAINWFTVNQYPKQQDYFYVYLFFFLSLTMAVSLWGLFIWKKSRR